MAVLNPPRALPGLGRAVINFLGENRTTWDEAGLIATFKPVGVSESEDTTGITNTLSSFRAIGMLNSSQGNITVSDSVKAMGSAFGRDEFRRVTLAHVLDLSRDGDPWALGEGEASSSGARDLTRGLSWFLAQDALGMPLSWATNVEQRQAEQFGPDKGQWVFQNDTRWGAFTRWALALGLARTAVLRSHSALVPLPTLAIADVVACMPVGQLPVHDFLGILARNLPILPGGVIREGLVTQLRRDPDPGLQRDALDTSVAQVLRILEVRGRITLDNMADAEGVFLSPNSHSRTTHITLKGGKKR